MGYLLEKVFPFSISKKRLGLTMSRNAQKCVKGVRAALQLGDRASSAKKKGKELHKERV